MRPTTSRNNSGFFIGVTCPGCGGSLELQSDFFVLNCPHCGSNLRIKMPEIPPAYLIRSEKPKRELRFHLDRYLKSRALPLSGPGLEIFSMYYPYWKIDAVLLKVRNEVLERQTVDEYNYETISTYEQRMTDVRLTPYTVTQAAGPPVEFIPGSIGIRPQYCKLLPYSQENTEDDFSSFPVLKNWNMVRKDLNGSVSAIGSIAQPQFGKNRTELFHPVGSIIYFPYYIIICNCRGEELSFLSDGITGKIIKQLDERPDHDQLNTGGTGNIEFGQLSVDFHRCSNCGVDLPDKQSYIYICDNCGVLTTLGNSPKKLAGVFSAGTSGKSGDRMFPFWTFKLNESDTSKLRRFFGGIYASNRLVIPAFKIQNFEAMYRLAKRISTAYPKLDIIALEKQGGAFADVSLGPEDALTMAEVIIYREYVSRVDDPRNLETTISPEEVSLVYAPFRKEHYFYVDSTLGAITFEKNLTG